MQRALCRKNILSKKRTLGWTEYCMPSKKGYVTSLSGEARLIALGITWWQQPGEH